MTGNQTVDNQNQNGEDGSPSQALSSGNGGSILDAKQVSQLLKAEISEALKPVLAEVRGVQGRQDKDRTAFRGFLDEYEKQKAKGLSNADAEQAANALISERDELKKRDALFQQIADKVLGTSSAGSGTPAQASIDVLKQFPELDANDPDVIAKVLVQTDPEKAELAASRLVRQRTTQSPPSPSAAGALETTPAKTQSLMEEYNRDAKNLRGNALIDLKMSYRKRGLDIN